jgi:DNA-binding NarL/FixJ family response regulator
VVAKAALQFRSESRPVRLGPALIDLKESSKTPCKTGSSTEAVTSGDDPKASGSLLELLSRTDELMNEVQTVLRRIGVEMERLGISSSTLPPSSRPPRCPELDSLSPRESEVVQLLTEGHRVSTIARSLFISPHTVRNHLQSVYRKVGVSSQAELIERLKGSASPSPVPTELRHCG